MNDEERRQWVNNDEGLYRWWQASGLSVRDFIKQNREDLDRVIEGTRDGTIPPHALAYPHDATCMCYSCKQKRRNHGEADS